jgi:hypothetical protein
MKKIILFSLISLLALTTQSWGQTTLLSQNFDGVSAPALPTGWTATAGIGTWATTASNSSSGYAGATGVNSVIATNNSASATLSLTYDNSLSTVGYTSIKVNWGAVKTGSFANPTFEWSSDGSTWNSVSGTGITTGPWVKISGPGISLASGAEGVANLRFRWTFTQVNNSDTYQIDDFSVTGTTASTNFYSKSSGNLDNSLNWGTSNDGSGSNPANFTTAGQIFNIRNNATPTIGANWTVSGGSGSKIVVGNGTNACNFTIPASYSVTGSIDVSANATLTMQNTTLPTFGTVSSSSTINFAQGGTYTISSLPNSCGNLIITGDATNTMKLGSVTCTVSGNMTVTNVPGFTGSSSGTQPQPSSNITLKGNLTLSGGTTMASTSTTVINLTCNGSSGQTLSGGSFYLNNLNISNSAGISFGNALQVLGTLTMTSGALSFTSGSLTYGASGMLSYNGSSAQTTTSVEFPASNGPYSLSINNPSGVTLHAARTINGNLGLNSGIFANGANLTLGNSASISRSLGTLNQAPNFGTSVDLVYSSGQITFTGDITSGSKTIQNVSSTAGLSAGMSITGTGFFSGTTISSIGSGTITVADNAGTTQTSVNFTATPSASTTCDVEMPTSSTVLNNLTIANSLGVTLSNSPTMKGQLSFMQGKLNTGSNTLTLSSSATISGEASGKYLVGTVTTTRAVGTGSSTFGGIGMTLDPSTDDLGNVTVTRVSGSHASLNSNTGINRIWTINPQNDLNLSRNLTLTWVSDDDNSKTLTSVQVWNSADNFTATANTVGTSADGSSRSITVSISGLTHSSSTSFTISQANQPLPVELNSFSASSSGSNVSLSWKTATEVNNYGFNVERKVETGDWTKVGFVQGHGTSNSPKSYSFTDSPTGGTKFQYRLKQMDTNGKYEYSNVLDVNIAAPVNYAVQQNYPNPFNPTTVISYQIPAAGNVSLKVFDVLGREVATLVDAYQNIGTYNQTFSADKLGLASGIYIYRLSSGSFSQIHKMILMK